jgi:hypothetical protein
MIEGVREERIASWWRFLEIAEALEKKSPPLPFFRGQARAEWMLQPRLARLTQGLDEKVAREIETIGQLEFQTQAHLFIPARMVFPHDDVVSQWGLMQQYGAPTRFLDWTLSPYVAAYFAAQQHTASDGAIWVVNGQRVQQATRERYGDRGVLPENRFEQKARLMELEGDPILSFTGLRVHTDRMGAQQMGYSVANRVVCDHAELIARLGAQVDALTKIVLPAELKPMFMRRLLRMNISGRSLFPGIEGLGRFAVELSELEAAHRRGLA